MLGHKHSDETKAKIAASNMGKHKQQHTIEHNAKISATLLGNQRGLKHGNARPGQVTREYNSWVEMIRRCTKSSRKDWKDYGGRGITVCDKWRESFQNFLNDMGERPEGTSIDRINNHGNYEPGNCRWATPLEQSSNRRVNS